MTLEHPAIKAMMDEWTQKLRLLTGDETVVIRAISSKSSPLNSLDELISLVCRLTGYSKPDLQTASRQRQRVVARQLICFYACKLGLGTLSQIGRELGDRDHTTVMHSRDAIINLLETNNPEVCRYVQLINSEIRSHEVAAC